VTVLRLRRRFDAPPGRVFDAWTDPEVLRRWWAAAPDWETSGADVDLRPGGRYRLSMRDTDTGAEHTVRGEYRRIERPDRLEYTWRWDAEPDMPVTADETLVVVEFRADGDGTEVVLTHSGFPDQHQVEKHAGGWTGCMDNLARRGLRA
jgi:uncharacterized protein YndB with AHSA1/START domain